MHKRKQATIEGTTEYEKPELNKIPKLYIHDNTGGFVEHNKRR